MSNRRRRSNFSVWLEFFFRIAWFVGIATFSGALTYVAYMWLTTTNIHNIRTTDDLVSIGLLVLLGLGGALVSLGALRIAFIYFYDLLILRSISPRYIQSNDRVGSRSHTRTQMGEMIFALRDMEKRDDTSERIKTTFLEMADIFEAQLKDNPNVPHFYYDDSQKDFYQLLLEYVRRKED